MSFVLRLGPLGLLLTMATATLAFMSQSPGMTSTQLLSETVHSNDNDVDPNRLSITETTPVESINEPRNWLSFEKSQSGLDGMPFAPMMTYPKYLTMQEKRVRVTIRYSAAAGLRPFFLTVAQKIKLAHPDVLLEKRILPAAGSDVGGELPIFEVVVDGKTVLGKKKTKMLKVRSFSSRSTGGDTVEEGAGSDSDIAGGRSVFFSMEKLEQELTKARKRRRPNTMYKSKEVALRSEGGAEGALVGKESGDVKKQGGAVGSNLGTSEAVLRLEKLKALSSKKS